MSRSLPVYESCYCTGPIGGAPYCPCEMRNRKIVIRDGRFIEPEKDLGPVPAVSWTQFTYSVGSGGFDV